MYTSCIYINIIPVFLIFLYTLVLYTGRDRYYYYCRGPFGDFESGTPYVADVCVGYCAV